MSRVCLYQRHLPPDRSGAGKQAVSLARALRAAGHDVLLLGDREASDPRPGAIEDVPAVWVDAPPPDPTYPQFLAYWRRVWSALWTARDRFDVLHVHNAAFAQSAAVPMARLMGRPVLVRSSLSGEFANLSRSRSGRLQRRALKLAGAFVVLSRELADEYLGSGLPPGRLHRIPNGVDGSVYRPVSGERKAALRRELDLPAGGRIMVYHGVFIERKSLHWLVETLGPHLGRLGLTLVLVGGPARDESRTGYAARLERAVAGSGAADRIIVRGFDPEVHRYLQAADLYVLPSLSEGLPNALVEAMAAGLVPFATRMGGTEDVIVHGQSGFLFGPRDAGAFLGCLEGCLSPQTDTSAASVARAARDRIASGFTLEAVAARYAELYRALVGRTGPAGAS